METLCVYDADANNAHTLQFFQERHINVSDNKLMEHEHNDDANTVLY